MPLEFEKDIESITLVTACSNKTYLKKLKYCAPTWKYCNQFKDKKLIVLYKDMRLRDFDFLIPIFKDIEFVDVNKMNINETNERDIMLSSFVFISEHIETDYFVKFDSDCWIETRVHRIFEPEHFKHSIVAHKWGYTKPGYWIDMLDNFLYNTNKPINKNKKIYREKRIQSFCCLHDTSFVQKCLKLCKKSRKLPVPSHDTFLYYLASRLDDCSFDCFNMSTKYVKHSSKFNTIRREISKSDLTFTEHEYLSKSIYDNLQMHITYDCNIGCTNCDRFCGKIKSNEYMCPEKLQEEIKKYTEKEIKFKRIDVIGGEPSQHPQLKTILEVLTEYQMYSNCKIRYSTNGLGEKAKEAIEMIKHNYPKINIRNSNKKDRDQDHICVTNAPVDNGCNVPVSCSIPWRCGIACTHKFEYFICGAASGIARVFDVNGASSIEDLNPLYQKHKFCNLCGHSNYFKDSENKENKISKTYSEIL